MNDPNETMRRASIPLALLAALALLVGACAAEDPVLQDEPTTTHADEGDDDEHVEFAFGEPADAADSDRIVEIEASDVFAFDPAEITVQVGETVTFRVTNAGQIPHDFTLGDHAVQDEHEAEMSEMAGGGMMMPDEANAFALEPGETKELTWHFTAPGEILIGCHQPGHYAAGMVGTITIEG